MENAFEKVGKKTIENVFEMEFFLNLETILIVLMNDVHDDDEATFADPTIATLKMPLFDVPSLKHRRKQLECLSFFYFL
jgi:hypothetical protein